MHCDLAFVGVEVREDLHEDFVADFGKFYFAPKLGCAFVQTHFVLELSREVCAAREKKLMRRHFPVVFGFQHERHVRKVRVSYPRAQVILQGRWWYFYLFFFRENEVVEIVKALNPVVPPKDVETALEDLAGVTKARAGCLPGAGSVYNGKPYIFVDFELVEV